ncbi:MAG TPA: hypothetical protein VKA84_18060 [Gemmatimonadaceae bacterium]|nr:hypothetical protein [Gemmatimonadaceae bacterium]
MSISTRFSRRALVGAFLSVAALAVIPAVAAAQVTPSDAWLKGLTSQHRQFFDSPAPAGGIPLVHIMNYYETLNGAYGVKDAGIDAVGTFYGATTFYGLNDAMWEKYRLGEFLETNDPATGKPAVANPWRAKPVVLGMTLPQASIESLQRRGATFILCNNALGIFAGLLAQARGLDAKAVYADLNANILPGVQLIPGMVVAIDQAHAAGLSYHRQ